jgi:hypothetical protein
MYVITLKQSITLMSGPTKIFIGEVLVASGQTSDGEGFFVTGGIVGRDMIDFEGTLQVGIQPDSVVGVQRIKGSAK